MKRRSAECSSSTQVKLPFWQAALRIIRRLRGPSRGHFPLCRTVVHRLRRRLLLLDYPCCGSNLNQIAASLLAVARKRASLSPTIGVHNGHPARTEVVVTGYGVISPIGLGGEAFWQALREGVSGIAEKASRRP